MIYLDTLFFFFYWVYSTGLDGFPSVKQVSNSESACSLMQQCAAITQVGTSYLASFLKLYTKLLPTLCRLGSNDEASSSILAAFLTLHLRCVSFLAIGFYHPVLMSNQDEWHDPVQFGVSLIKNSYDINLLLVLRFLFGTPTALSSHMQYFTSHFLINYIF